MKAPLRMRKNAERPHYYHVICYDLIVDELKKNSSEKMHGVDKAEYCLVCDQEKKLFKEKEEKKKQEKEHEVLYRRLSLRKT